MAHFIQSWSIPDRALGRSRAPHLLLQALPAVLVLRGGVHTAGDKKCEWGASLNTELNQQKLVLRFISPVKNIIYHIQML